MDSTARFVELLLRHERDLLRFILPLVGGDLNDAQDVLQETAKALWLKFDQYDSHQPFSPWARQFARNEALMWLRKKRRYTFMSEELITQLIEQQAARETVQADRQQALQNCLAKLSANDRRLLERRYAERAGAVADLAGEFQLSANALYKTLGRIRKNLLDCLRRSLATA